MRHQRNPLPVSRFVFPALWLLLSLGLYHQAQAQTSTIGNISGTVRDPNGALVAKAEVVITEERTGFMRTVKTDDAGFYLAPSLSVGRYTVSTAPQGFKKTVNSGLELHVNENLVVNLTLEIGVVSEVFTVTAERFQVETRSGDVSSLIGEKQVN